ncbi:hypothetical protein BCR35DRAFT_298845 [Leucosporidium creatinivorum]|uniref:UspA domain-containing protein n=1 Tax=Leucosporidium creatinivorum TaxID=106004 RepID=A0A1Y2G2J5_9BASI|nr:hypothetical protein BCR35DRAFT_298845 [Leucosporidium creatinivorum]
MASFLKRVTSKGDVPSLSLPKDNHDDERSRSRSRGRSLSPFRRRDKSDKSKSQQRDPSAEGLRRDVGMESGDESDSAPVVCPSNAFASDSEDDEEWDEEDEELERNTEANSSLKTPLDFIEKEGLDMVYPGEGPNLLSQPPVIPPGPTPLRRKPTKSNKLEPLVLSTGRPVYEKNRCTVVLTHGDPEKVGEQGRRRRRYLVASDLSEESLYAIEWAIGTVLRDGDECLLVSVMETDTKFDSDDANPSSSEKKAKITNQRERQANALMLSRQATALLERTRLNVTIICQAIHAKVPRHMLIDMIDYHEPTLVIVGSRGLAKIKGMLLGSVSNYLIQKSSVPVMVTRRPLRVSHTVHRKLSSLNREARTTLSQATIEKESKGGAVEDGEFALSLSSLSLSGFSV